MERESWWEKDTVIGHCWRLFLREHPYSKMWMMDFSWPHVKDMTLYHCLSRELLEEDYTSAFSISKYEREERREGGNRNHLWGESSTMVDFHGANSLCPWIYQGERGFWHKLCHTFPVVKMAWLEAGWLGVVTVVENILWYLWSHIKLLLGVR